MWTFPFLIAVAGSMSQPKKEPAPTFVQHGELSQNDSEITLLINSTYEIIEGIENNSTDPDFENENSGEEERPKPINFNRLQKLKREQCPSKSLFRLQPRKIGTNSAAQSTVPTTSCKKFSTKEKYNTLEGVGGRNQMLMADSPEEASRGFVHIYPAGPPEQDAVDFGTMTAEGGPDPTTHDPLACDERCQLIKKTLIEATTGQKLRTAVKSTILRDAGQPEVDEGFVTATGCYLETFIPVGNCSEFGEETSWGFEHLCSECRGVYMMSNNCFPKFLNAVQCNNKELGCIFNTFSSKAHGVCQMQTLVLNILRNRGDNSCEDWVVENIQLPVACQCMLSKSSWLRSSPPKEL